MTTLTVNLLDDTSVEMGLRVLGGMTQTPHQTVNPTETDEQPDAAPEQPDAAPQTEAESDEQPDAAPQADADEQSDPSKTDIHGLAWDASVHSNPPKMNADGSWRVGRGKSDEHAAAVKAAQKAHENDADQPEPTVTGMPTPTAMPQPTAMPTPQPAAPAPTAPTAPVDYTTMGNRFLAMMESGAIQDFNAIYQALQIDHGQLETNQTMIDRIWNYMDALDQGETHDAAVRHAMGS